MYYGGIILLALSIWQIRCVMYNMTNLGQINNFSVLVLVLVLVLMSTPLDRPN